MTAKTSIQLGPASSCGRLLRQNEPASQNDGTQKVRIRK